MQAETFAPCTLLLAHTLNTPWVNCWPLAPFEPDITILLQELQLFAFCRRLGPM